MIFCLNFIHGWVSKIWEHKPLSHPRARVPWYLRTLGGPPELHSPLSFYSLAGTSFQRLNAWIPSRCRYTPSLVRRTDTWDWHLQFGMPGWNCTYNNKMLSFIAVFNSFVALFFSFGIQRSSMLLCPLPLKRLTTRQ